jgi:hypothetical protein
MDAIIDLLRRHAVTPYSGLAMPTAHTADYNLCSQRLILSARRTRPTHGQATSRTTLRPGGAA